MKKWIKLNRRADIAGEIRSPREGAIAVDAEVADTLIRTNAAVAAVNGGPSMAGGKANAAPPEPAEAAAPEQAGGAA